MISVTSRASRSAQISACRHGLVVHALAVICKLVRGNAVGLHVRGVRVAARARLRDVEGMDVGTRVSRWAQIVHSMAIDANGHFRIAFRKQFAVYAGLVLAELICAQAWIVLA